MGVFCYVLAAICLLYCADVAFSRAAGTRFFLIWLVIAAFLVALGGCFRKYEFSDWSWQIKTVFLVVSGIALAVFCFVEGLVLSGFGREAEPGLAYVIVLGAQIRQNGPSGTLAMRLDRAAAYLKHNPHTMCVVSGGQGSNEPISEAAGMRDYLLEKGIAPGRILTEDRSTNTKQNLEYSRRLIPAAVKKVGSVTNNFHIYRSIRLAKSQGFDEAQGIASPSALYFLPNNMLREFLGILKDRIKGNMRLF